jgi:hypothetical protein
MLLGNGGEREDDQEKVEGIQGPSQETVEKRGTVAIYGGKPAAGTGECCGRCGSAGTRKSPPLRRQILYNEFASRKGRGVSRWRRGLSRLFTGGS